MHPISQYQAHHLLELVASNRAKVKPHDHVDSDIWARADPPVRGRVYATRATAKQDLKAGHMGAEVVRVEKAETERHALLTLEPAGGMLGEKEVAPIDGHIGAGVGTGGEVGGEMMMRVGSEGSRVSKISSVPSFGRMREPLSEDSVRLSQMGGENGGAGVSGLKGEAARKRLSARAEYEEFGSEALITRVYDEGDEDVEGEVSGRLFREIGPSVSMAHGIGEEKEEGGYEEEYVVAETKADTSPRGTETADAEGIGEKSSNAAVVALVQSPPPPPPSPLLPSVMLAVPTIEFDEKGEGEVVATVTHSSPPSPPPLPKQPSVYREGEDTEREGIAPPPPTPPPAEAFVKREGVECVERGEGEEGELCCHEKEESEEEGKRSTCSSEYLSRSEYTGYSEDVIEKAKEKKGEEMPSVETLGSMESAPEEVIRMGE